MEDGQADMAKVSDNEMEFWRNYSLAALEKWREIERSVTRTSGLMVLVAAVFELINRKSVAEVTLPFVKLTNPGLVQISLPVVIAYLYSNLTELSSEADWTSRAYELSFKRVRPIDPVNSICGH